MRTDILANRIERDADGFVKEMDEMNREWNKKSCLDSTKRRSESKIN